VQVNFRLFDQNNPWTPKFQVEHNTKRFADASAVSFH